MKPTFPHWLQLVLSAVGVLLIWTTSEAASGALVLPTWAAGIISAVLAIGVGLGWWSGSAISAKAAARVVGSMLALLTLAATCAGCLDAPIVPVTPANAQQVSQCQGAASLHNGLVFGDYVVGGGGAVTGVVSAALPASDVSAKTDLAIAGAVAAGVATLGAGFAALESHAYATDKCSAFIEPLFSTHAPTRAEQP